MRKKLLTACDLFIAVTVPAAWLTMVFRGGGSLSARGLWSLRYFTVLSNLLAGLAALLALAARRGGKAPRRALLLKYAAASAVGLTFLVVMAFLGPVFGYGGMFQGANFWFHLVVPLAAIVSFALLEEHLPLSLGESLLGIVPMLLYGAVYLANILVNGVGEGMATNDWYGFTMWGMKAVPLVYLTVAAANWGIALLLRWGNRKGGRP